MMWYDICGWYSEKHCAISSLQRFVELGKVLSNEVCVVNYYHDADDNDDDDHHHHHHHFVIILYLFFGIKHISAVFFFFFQFQFPPEIRKQDLCLFKMTSILYENFSRQTPSRN